jgi:ectoine hydroxylase-related dioxygenase (phytanoyl-CoA dioxygenase family)
VLGRQLLSGGVAEVQRQMVMHWVTGGSTRMKWQLNTAQGLELHGGQAAVGFEDGPSIASQRLHRTSSYLGLDFRADLETRVDALWALSSSGDAQPTSFVVAGSHRLPKHTLRAIEGTEGAAPISLPAGACLLFCGSTFHALAAPGGAVTADRPAQRLLSTSYIPAFMYEEELQLLSNPPEVARHFPISIQRLCGYQVYAGSLGYWGDRQHPIEAFDLRPVDWARHSNPKL